LQLTGVDRISSASLGEYLGFTDTQVRKDLSILGSPGLPGIGYDVAELTRVIRSTLGLDRTWSAALVGVGNLARALLRYNGFLERGFRIVALFDDDPVKVGQQLDDLRILPLSRLRDTIKQVDIQLAILTLPADCVQMVAEQLIECGVRGLLNFAPTVVRVPPHVSVVNVDLTVQLEQLAFLVHLGADLLSSTR
jgi:redox-sensing transcriptional repressor